MDVLDEVPLRIGFTKEEARVILRALTQYQTILVSHEDKINSLPPAISIVATHAYGQEHGAACRLSSLCDKFVCGTAEH